MSKSELPVQCVTNTASDFPHTCVTRDQEYNKYSHTDKLWGNFFTKCHPNSRHHYWPHSVELILILSILNSIDIHQSHPDSDATNNLDLFIAVGIA